MQEGLANYWDKVFSTKKGSEVSWYQPYPKVSVDMITGLHTDRTARIIDIGGGECALTEALLDIGFQDLTVLDISKIAVEKGQERLGERAAQVKWVVTDITKFETESRFDIWHDRAAFHFLTAKEDIDTYRHKAASFIVPGGYLVLGTFSENGPKKCSGLDITQYSIASLQETFSADFEPIECFQQDHPTPFGTVQNFTFCTFRRR